MGSVRFRATLQSRGPAAAAVLDAEQVAIVGEGAKRFPVRATVADFSCQTTVTRMKGEFLLGFNREVCEATGAGAGDEVEIELVLEDGPREVELPEDLGRALDLDRTARWVGEAKRPETRERRIAQTLEMVKEGRTR